MAALPAAAATAVPPPAAAAVVLPMEAAAAAAAAGAGAAPAAAARPETNWRKLRVKWAAALFLLGCASAALAVFAMTNSPTVADSRRVLGACALTDAEAAALRAASERLLLAAAAQVLGATTAVLVPVRPVAVFASLLGWQTGYCAPRVLRMMLVACDGRADVVLAIYYGIFVAVMWVAFVVGAVVSAA